MSSEMSWSQIYIIYIYSHIIKSPLLSCLRTKAIEVEVFINDNIEQWVSRRPLHCDLLPVSVEEVDRHLVVWPDKHYTDTFSLTILTRIFPNTQTNYSFVPARLQHISLPSLHLFYLKQMVLNLQCIEDLCLK